MLVVVTIIPEMEGLRRDTNIALDEPSIITMGVAEVKSAAVLLVFPSEFN